MATISSQEFFGGKPATVVGNETQTDFKKSSLGDQAVFPTPENRLQPVVNEAKGTFNQLADVGNKMSQIDQKIGPDTIKNTETAFGSKPAVAEDQGSFGKNFIADLTKRLASTGHIAGDIAGMAFAPLATTFEAMIPPTIKNDYQKSVEWVANKITSSPEATKILNTINTGADNIHPDLKKALFEDLPNVLSLLGGDKASDANPDVSLTDAKKAIKIPVQDVQKTGQSMIDSFKTATNNVTEEMKHKIFGLPSEQIKNTTADWARPAESPKPSYKKANTILKNSPDTPKFLAEQGLDPISHIEDGNYNTKETAQSLRDTAATMSNETLRPSLQAADYSTPRTDVSAIESRAIAEARQTKGLTAGNMNSIIQSIKEEAIALKQNYPNGLSLEDMHDNKIDYANSKNSGYSPVNDPKVNNSAVSNRSMASAFQKVLEEKAPPEIPVHDFNQYLSQYHKAADYLMELNSKKAPLTLTQNIANRTAKAAGAIVGAHVGGLPTEFAGYSIGGALEHAVENMPNPVRVEFLQNLQRVNPKAFEQVVNYLGEEKTKALTQLHLPEGAPLGSEKNPIVPQAPTTFEKPSLRSFNQNQMTPPRTLLKERASPMITPLKALQEEKNASILDNKPEINAGLSVKDITKKLTPKDTELMQRFVDDVRIPEDSMNAEKPIISTNEEGILTKMNELLGIDQDLPKDKIADKYEQIISNLFKKKK